MRAPGAPPPTRANVARWRSVMATLLQRAGLADALDWKIAAQPLE